MTPERIKATREICEPLSKSCELASPLAELVLHCLDEIEFLHRNLNDIACPILALQKQAEEEDMIFNGAAAIMLCQDASYLREKAIDAINEYNVKFK